MPENHFAASPVERTACGWPEGLTIYGIIYGLPEDIKNEIDIVNNVKNMRSGKLEFT